MNIDYYDYGKTMDLQISRYGLIFKSLKAK